MTELEIRRILKQENISEAELIERYRGTDNEMDIVLWSCRNIPDIYPVPFFDVTI